MDEPSLDKNTVCWFCNALMWNADVNQKVLYELEYFVFFALIATEISQTTWIFNSASKKYK